MTFSSHLVRFLVVGVRVPLTIPLMKLTIPEKDNNYLAPLGMV